jgi:hypothetical protein
MKNLKLTTIILILTTCMNCSKKVYTENQLRRIAKTDSIKKQQKRDIIQIQIDLNNEREEDYQNDNN